MAGFKIVAAVEIVEMVAAGLSSADDWTSWDETKLLRDDTLRVGKGYTVTVDWVVDDDPEESVTDTLKVTTRSNAANPRASWADALGT